MALELLGQQMLLGDLELFLVGVAGQLNDLHPVQQRLGKGRGGVGRGDKQHLGQIKGELHKVIPEGTVLLPVQHFQQSRSGVAPHVAAQLVDFVQQKQRISGARLADGIDDPSGHRPHIGFPVAPDIRLIMDAAQGNSSHFPVQCPGHGHSNGGLSHSRRAHQAEDLPLQIRGQLLDRQKLQNPLLHLFQAEVVRVQNLPGRLDVDPLLGGLGPGQLQAHIQVVPQHRGLRRAEGLLLQVHYLFEQLGLHLLRQLGIGNLPAVGGQLIVAVLSQLLLDHPHLLPQKGVLLVLGHVLLDPALDALLHLQDLHLPAEEAVHLIQPLDRPELIQDGLLVQHPHGDILGKEVGNIAGVLAGHDIHQHLRRGVLGGEFAVSVKELIGLANGRLRPEGIGLSLIVLTGLHRLYLGHQVGIGLGQFVEAGSGLPLHHHPDGLPRQAENLTDHRNRPHGKKMVSVRLLHPDVLLGHQENGLVGRHGLFNGLHGGLPTHIKVDHHFRIYRQTPQGQSGHGLHWHGFSLFFLWQTDSLPFNENWNLDSSAAALE